MQIIDDDLYQRIWDKIFTEYSFYPSVSSRKRWLIPNGVFQAFRFEHIWKEQQEAIVNAILCDVIGEEMYALDWQHDCFLFDPHEKIPIGYESYDIERNCNVYFPEYYPDGDYHFFISKDWNFGLYGHPWKKELIVVGEDLIFAIEKKCSELGLKRKSLCRKQITMPTLNAADARNISLIPIGN